MATIARTTNHHGGPPVSDATLLTADENPKGFHRRYNITKADGTPCDPRAVYLVLRLDNYGDDKEHIEACRLAAKKYVQEAPPHMRQMAKELAAMLDRFMLNASEDHTNGT